MINKLKNIPKENKGGSCYERAVNFVLDNHLKMNLKLCHGNVTGQGVIAGIRYSHAWVEDDNGIVYDPSINYDNPRIFLVSTYYSLGKIEPKEVKTYSLDEMRDKLLETEHYGPWIE